MYSNQAKSWLAEERALIAKNKLLITPRRLTHEEYLITDELKVVGLVDTVKRAFDAPHARILPFNDVRHTASAVIYHTLSQANLEKYMLLHFRRTIPASAVSILGFRPLGRFKYDGPRELVLSAR